MDVSLEAKRKPVCTLSSYSYIPPKRTEAKECAYFNSESKAPNIFLYDCLFHRPEGYNNKLHRDDRQHVNGGGLDLFTEESFRPVPVLSSSSYGRRTMAPIYKSERQHVRVGIIRADFFRKNGISRSVEEGYGSVAPV